MSPFRHDENRQGLLWQDCGQSKQQGRSNVPRDTRAALALCDSALHRQHYCWVTAPLATPPPEDCTQTVVGRNGVTCRKAQVPSAAIRAVPTGTPVQLAPLAAAAPAQMVTPPAKPPPGIWVLVPWTRRSPVATVSSARVIVTVSVGAAFTTWFTVAEVLTANVALPS